MEFTEGQVGQLAGKNKNDPIVANKQEFTPDEAQQRVQGSTDDKTEKSNSVVSDSGNESLVSEETIKSEIDPSTVIASSERKAEA